MSLSYVLADMCPQVTGREIAQSDIEADPRMIGTSTITPLQDGSRTVPVQHEAGLVHMVRATREIVEDSLLNFSRS
jgi:hypothetical protein